MSRSATISRRTLETDVAVTVDLDGPVRRASRPVSASSTTSSRALPTTR